MFDNLSSRLQGIFGGLRSKGRLSEADIDSALREVRMALLEADVNYKVVKSFIGKCKERCLEAKILDSLNPAQNVIKVVLDELSALMGGSNSKLILSSRIPNVIMMVGLQGSGKTTASAKLAYRLKKDGHSPLLVACDVYRPAAADQLQSLGDEIGVKVYRSESTDPVEIAKAGVRCAIDTLRDVVIIDTAGRLHVDDLMMEEAANIKAATKPDQIIMVLDAMTGQDAVNVAQSFSSKVDFDAVIMSKMDGDARGGGALSVRGVTGKPIMFISAGEKPQDLEPFHPDRMAKRILGMGDVVSIVEKAAELAQQEESRKQAERMMKEEFSYNDFLDTLKQVKKMGGLSSLISNLPGGDKALANGQVDEGELDRIEAIINSMTKQERSKPSLINGSRRERIAKGAGVEVFDVNQVIKRFDETRKMMKKLKSAVPQQGKGGKKGKKGGASKGQYRQMMSMMKNMGLDGMDLGSFK